MARWFIGFDHKKSLSISAFIGWFHMLELIDIIDIIDIVIWSAVVDKRQGKAKSILVYLYKNFI